MPDEATLRNMPLMYSRLLNSFDTEGVVSLFTEDILFENPVGRPPMMGREALRTHLRWAAESKVHETPGRSVTSMDGRYVVTPVAIRVPDQMDLRMISIVELDEDGRGRHLQAFWGLTDMTLKSPGRGAGLDPPSAHQATPIAAQDVQQG